MENNSNPEIELNEKADERYKAYALRIKEQIAKNAEKEDKK